MDSFKFKSGGIGVSAIVRTNRFATATMLMIGLLAPASAAPKVFSTANEAANSLGQAVNNPNRATFVALFGEEADWLANPDTVQGAREVAEFAAAYNATNHLVRESETRMVLEVGTDAWPFPIPVVKTASGWSFDTEAGREEILNRRIGRNELDVLQVMRTYVEAQREYASRDRDADGVLEYAQKLSSSPGQTDGLYWPREVNGEVSPLGPLVAEAQYQGYFRTPSDTPQPFHGYFFKILKRQGKHAPGGKYNYVINGNMIGGFALVAWPAEYRESGVMTFIVNQQGKVYQKDLGAATRRIVEKMNDYNPDSTWKPSPE